MCGIVKAVLMGLICLFGMVCGSVSAQAHGVSYVLVESERAVAFEATFSTGEPVAYGEVLIFSPLDAGLEFMNGRTDARGRFAFVPDTKGLWHVDVNAGLGHKLTFNVDVASDGVGAVESSMAQAVAPVWGKALLGVSLLLNICWLGRLKGSRRKKHAAL